MATVLFGSNRFTAHNEFVVIGQPKQGGIILGGFGNLSEMRPLVWITIRNNIGFLNADILDADNEIVLQIRNNEIRINKDNIYKATVNQNAVQVINQYGETALDLKNQNGLIIFNGDFYIGKDHIVATDNGTTINPTGGANV